MNQIQKYGSKDVEVLILASVNKCIQSLDIEMDNSTVSILVEDIVEKFKYDSIEDIQLCLKKGRQGNYGPVYGKINMIIVTEWMAKHLEEKSREREKIIEARKSDGKFTGWETREDYIKEAKKPIQKTVKEKRKDSDDEYRKFRAEYIANKQNKS